MTIPLNFITRYAIPFLVASLYLGGDVDIPQQMRIFESSSILADKILSEARGEGEDGETFDYIIVGGGSAGAILANKLTASGEYRVLLLEAGGDPNPVYEVPFVRKFYHETGINDWGFGTVKQEKGCRDTGGHCYWPRGKALGGSSTVNGLLYNRCKPKDYDLWANFTGDSSWSWKNIRETFNSFENYQGFYKETDGERHGDGGAMFIGKNDYLPGQDVVEDALREKGFTLGDLNGGEELINGFAKTEYNIKDGLRWGTYQAFLQPILNRTNLSIYRYAYAIKVETESLGNLTQAVGVTYERHGVTRTAMVNKEVILAGGVVGSAKLLMLSGIGPMEHLEELGIQTILDLPVGQYLQDHPGIDLVGENGGFLVNTTFAKNHNTSESILQFIEGGKGPLGAFNFDNSESGGYASQIMRGYLNTSRNDDRSWPELQIYIYSRYQPKEDRQEFYFAVELVRHSTFGRITLASKDPHDKPVIDPNLLGNPEDVERMVDGIEAMMDVFLNSTTFQKYGIKRVEGSYKPCEGRQEGRDYWKCLVEHKTIYFFHPTSTCRMGLNSNVAVLDSKMKVFGSQNLRVMDASSMPFAPSGNTNLPAMLMGARGAEIILSGQ